MRLIIEVPGECEPEAARFTAWLGPAGELATRVLFQAEAGWPSAAPGQPGRLLVISAAADQVIPWREVRKGDWFLHGGHLCEAVSVSSEDEVHRGRSWCRTEVSYVRDGCLVSTVHDGSLLTAVRRGLRP